MEAKQREKSLDFLEVGRLVPVQRRQREEKAAEQREKERLEAEQRLKAKMPPRCDNLHLQGPTKAVQCVAFSSDGTLVASGSGDGQDHAAVVLDVAGIRLQPSILFGIDGSKSETKTQVEGDIGMLFLEIQDVLRLEALSTSSPAGNSSARKLFFLPAQRQKTIFIQRKSDDEGTLRLFSFVIFSLITLSRKLAKQPCRARLLRCESYKPLNHRKLPKFVTVSIQSG